MTLSDREHALLRWAHHAKTKYGWKVIVTQADRGVAEALVKRGLMTARRSTRVPVTTGYAITDDGLCALRMSQELARRTAK